MELASVLLSPMCDRLIDLAIQEYGLLRNLKEEAKHLQSTVILIKAVLHDAEEKEAKDAAVRVWLRQLKQILLDAEDILDEVATGALLRQRSQDGSELEMGTRQTKVRNIICCFRWVEKISGDHDMACRIKTIRLKMAGIYEEKNKLGLQIGVPREYRPTRPSTCSLLAVDGSYISGREDEKEKMIQLLLRSEEVVESNIHTGSVEVYVIVGIGGVGKTTLAKLIFNDPRVKENFQLMMWVCVSEDFDLKRIYREIIEATSEEGKELSETFNWDLHQRRFKKKIEGKRFLLVLDDLWEEDSSKWEALCEPLIYGAKGSKIMVTTRKQKTFKMVNGIPFSLEVMSSEALWPIFRRYAFGNEEPSEKMQLEIVGRHILKKLKGLPLAARVIGRLLNGNLDMDFWIDILKSEIFTSQRNDILPVLKLSYDHLSMNLKQCFAYCSLFPKDYIFSKDVLISMWMAQNFVHNTRDHCAERVGRESFEDLLNKSFFDPFNVESPSDDFKMHDLIHDLAESISEDDCFRLGDEKQKRMSENVRHVSVATDSLDVSRLTEVLNHGNLRTLVFLHQKTIKLTPNLDDLFMKLKRLRILGLRRCEIKKLPSSIGKLKHLRLVDLSENPIRNLPDSMGDLINLQVLKLKGCRLLGALPGNTSALVNLRHLELDTEIASGVQGLRKLTALQELIVTGSKVGELADMSMLKELRIRGLEGVASKEEVLHARLEAKEHLELLELNWSRDDRPRQHSVLEEEVVVDALKPVNRIRRLSVRFYEGARSPTWMGDPSWVSTSLLEEVVLRDCRNWEVLPPLSHLPGLKFLTIRRMSGVRRIGAQFFSCCCCCDDGGGGGGVKLTPGFPSLEELKFEHMPEWEEWESPVVEQQHLSLFLPRLRKLHLFNCKKLRELPPLPPTLTSLDLYKVGMTRLPGWMMRRCETPSTSSSSPSLSSLQISDCPNLTFLEDGLLLHPLPMLKVLSISGCDELASLPDGLFRHLNSLQKLEVGDCPDLSWLPSATEEDALLPSSLKEVRLHGCGGDTTVEQLLLPGGGLQKLTSLSRLDVDVSSSATLLGLGALTSLTHLGITGDDHVDDGALSTCLQGLTSLKSLSISNCSAITALTSSEVVLRRLSSLESLDIKNCGEMRSLGGVAGLVTLGKLEIINCPKLFHLVFQGAAVSSPSASSTTVAKISVKTLSTCSSSPEQIATWLRQVSSLQELFISDCPQLSCFGNKDVNGDQLEDALLVLTPSLRRLHLSACENLSSLPSKLRSLSCLEELSVYGCPKIQRLPSMGLPETLEEVAIDGCPELEQRCREVGCLDWALLSHIPDVRIG